MRYDAGKRLPGSPSLQSFARTLSSGTNTWNWNGSGRTWQGSPSGSTAVAPSLPGHAQTTQRGPAADLPDLPDGVAPASGPRAMRRRLGTAPMAPLKLASGCDRRCTFCAIPTFRGSFVSRRPTEVLDEVEVDGLAPFRPGRAANGAGRDA